MKNKRQTLHSLLLAAAFALLAVLYVAQARELAATRAALATLQADLDTSRTLVRVIDGDTVELDGGERVRILGIDTPELREKTPAGGWRLIDRPEPGARESRDWLRSFEGRPVRLAYDAERKDHYGRTLAHVYILPDGPDVATELLRRGWADLCAMPPNTTRYGDWKAARDGLPSIKSP